MQAAALDRDAELRRRVLRAIARCRYCGVPDWQLRGKNLLELEELAERGFRRLMTSRPKSA